MKSDSAIFKRYTKSSRMNRDLATKMGHFDPDEARAEAKKPPFPPYPSK